MARFRYSGTNWEGRSFYVADPIRRIGQAVEIALPSRHVLDGTVASKAHDARSPNSDHRPARFLKRGIVRAIDIGIYDKAMGDVLAAVLDELPSVNYVLWGVSNHESHIHVSTLKSYDDYDREVYVFSQSEVAALKRFVAEVQDEMNSNMGFVRQCIADIREKNAAGGHYAPHDHDHGGTGGGLGYGDTVKIARP